MQSLTEHDIAAQRLVNQRVGSGQCQTPADVVRWMGALQAQDYGQALWAVGSRLQQPSLKAVEAATEAGEILRTWPMRGTVHYVPAQDARWMLQLGAARMLANDARRMRQLDLDDKLMARCSELLTGALQGGKRLPRAAVLQVLETAGVSTKNGRGYHILWHLSQKGLLCIGPHQGKQQTFALLDEWAPQPQHYNRDQALAVLAERYFTGHGPATLQDFGWWSGLPAADAKRALEMAAPHLHSVTLGKSAYWYKTLHDTAAARGVHLLAGFDEYLLGYRDRTAVMQLEHSNHVIPGGNGVFRPILVVDGQVVGTWQRKIAKTTVTVTVTPFAPVKNLAKQCQPAAQAYAGFHGLQLRLVTT